MKFLTTKNSKYLHGSEAFFFYFFRVQLFLFAAAVIKKHSLGKIFWKISEKYLEKVFFFDNVFCPHCGTLSKMIDPLDIFVEIFVFVFVFDRSE